MNTDKIKNNIIDFLYLFSGIGSSGLSIYYSIKMFMYGGVSVIPSILFASTYVVFLNLIFTTGVKKFLLYKTYTDKLTPYKDATTQQYILLNKRRLHSLYTSIFIFSMWFILVTHSILSTIGGQYDQISLKNKNKSEEFVHKTDKAVIQKEIELLNNQKTSTEKEIAIVLNRLATVENIEKSYYYKNTSKSNESRLDYLKDKTEVLNNVISDKLNDLSVLNNKEKSIVNGDIYNYFARLTGIPSLVIQFIFNFFPAVVIDFFSPISFSIFLYRKRYKED